jgi:hypothetical protein
MPLRDTSPTGYGRFPDGHNTACAGSNLHSRQPRSVQPMLSTVPRAEHWPPAGLFHLRTPDSILMSCVNFGQLDFTGITVEAQAPERVCAASRIHVGHV